MAASLESASTRCERKLKKAKVKKWYLISKQSTADVVGRFFSEKNTKKQIIRCQTFYLVIYFW